MAVVRPTLVTDHMLAQIVGSLGGVWFADSEVPSGTIESGPSAVHVYTSRPVNLTVFDSHKRPQETDRRRAHVLH
jgi:hypothetical protein